MVECKLSAYASQQHVNRLQGLIPRPQNFHKRCILLQDTMNALYGSIPSEVGTLVHIHNTFGHHGVKKATSDCVNQVVDFLNFTTEGFICLLVLELLRIDSLKSPLPELPQDTDLQLHYVEKLARELVSFIWPNDDTESTESSHLAEDYPEEIICVCDSDEDIQSTIMIECSSLQRCNRGRWFHDVCVRVGSEAAADDWWCSDECRNMGTSAYCCMVAMPDCQWVVCQRGDNCPRGAKFHLECVNLAEIPETWYCSTSCKIGNQGSDDDVQQYSLAVTWRGLLQMVERDAERENDGEMMMTLWILNMPEFWKGNHYKYLILGHRLLASVNGWMPRRIREELVWNSTANLQGEPGSNIALDLLNEFLNNEFKSNLKHLHGIH